MPVRLDRHDRRLLSEDFSSVQASVGEVRRFFAEIMSPSDEAAVDDVADTLLEPAKRDWQTLVRAVGDFRQTIVSFDHYGETAFDTREGVRLLTAISEQVQVLEVALDRARVAAQLDGSATRVLVECAPQAESACRALTSFAERVCVVYGVNTRGAAESGGARVGNVEVEPETELLMPLLLLNDDADSSFDSNDDSGDDEREMELTRSANFIDDDEEKVDEDWRAALISD